MATELLEAAALTCLICDTPNRTGASICESCSAPLSLVLAATDREPRIVSVIGDSNVGKTVFLGFLLDMLAQRANNFEAIPKGAYSLDLPQTVISHMAYRMFPPKTPMESHHWNWAYYQVTKRSKHPKWVDLVMPDMAGEAIAAELASPSTFRVIERLIHRSAGLLLLVDAALAGNGSTQPDFFALKMLSYIDAMFSSKRRQKIDMPIAVVLTKADYFPEAFDNPERFIGANLSRFAHMCASRCNNLAFFASSVVGALGYATSENEDTATPIPLHTSLRGVMEPFEWMVAQL
ncbi:MAG: hypothetical protein IPM18_05330 [Phycisphaerales bacterium]|nr:hypothetical protein [Phycisphaerales bacterium]